MNKNYDFKELEKKWTASFSQTKRKESNKTMHFMMPPPNVTGSLHLGHAMENTCLDILSRYYQLKNYSVHWVPGQDHAGISTQSLVEKNLFATTGQTKKSLGKKKFLEEIWKWKEEHSHIILDQLKALGISCDWDSFKFTLDPSVSKIVREVFYKLFQDNLIYQKESLVNWDTTLQTAVSDIEVEHKKTQSFFYFIKYCFVDDPSEFLLVATTRPETIFADVALVVHPEDDLYKNFLGREVFIPFSKKKIPILSHESVDPEKGSGVLKVTPRHDFTDFSIAQDLQLPLGPELLNSEGIFQGEESLFLKNLTVEDARKLIEKHLVKEQYLEKKIAHTNETPYSERSKTPIEPRISKQWYLKIESLAKNAYTAVESNEIQIIHESWKNTYFAWMKNPQDWCLSRQLVWGHTIPIITCLDCSFQTAFIDTPTECSQCHSSHLKFEEDVFDTWFSSGLWPFVCFDTLPLNLLFTGHDILFFWAARMIMLGLYYKQTIPFKEIYLHPLVCDEQGRKMSKSLKNGIDIFHAINLYGVDALRICLSKEVGYNRTMNFSEKKLEISRNFLNKTWNLFYFISPSFSYNPDYKPRDEMENWIFNELALLQKNTENFLKLYRFDEVFKELEFFLYENLSHLLLEFCKKNISHYKELLSFIFIEFLKLLYPFAPFIAEDIFYHFFKKSITLAESYEVNPIEHNFHTTLEHLKAIRSFRHFLEINPKEKIIIGIKHTVLYSEMLQEQGNCLFEPYNSNHLYITKPFALESFYFQVDEALYKKSWEKNKKDFILLEEDLLFIEKKLHNTDLMKKAPEKVITELQEKRTVVLHKIEELKNFFSSHKM
jgi:valyl-tRNA synthetase